MGSRWSSLLSRGLSTGTRRGFQHSRFLLRWCKSVSALEPGHGCLSSPSVSVSKRALGPRFSSGRPDRTGRAAGLSLAGWTAALRRARPGGRSGTKPRLSLRCSSAASLPRGVRRPPGLPLAVPARRAAAARPRGARGLPRPRGRAALPSPPPGKRPEPGARLRGGQDCGWRRSRLRLPRDGLRQQQAVPLPPVRRSQGNAAGGLLALGCFGGRRCGGGLVAFFFFSFFFPRPGAAGRAAAASVCYCEPLTHLAGGSWSARQSLGVVLVVFSLRKLQIFILVHASFTVLRCPCQQSLGLCCKVMLLHPS